MDRPTMTDAERLYELERMVHSLQGAVLTLAELVEHQHRAASAADVQLLADDLRREVADRSPVPVSAILDVYMTWDPEEQHRRARQLSDECDVPF